MTKAEILATIETVSWQISDQREGWIAGARWVLAQLDAPEPQPRLPAATTQPDSEWRAAEGTSLTDGRFDRDAYRALLEKAVEALEPWTRIAFSFDGYGMDDAEMMLEGRKVCAVSPELHDFIEVRVLKANTILAALTAAIGKGEGT